jgi:hypothetical protein
LLLLAAATLLLEVSLTRILSVTLWYHFAFMVISTALFGLGFAGVVLSLRRAAASVSARMVAAWSLSTPLAFLAGYALFMLVPFEPFSLGSRPVQWLYLPLSYLAVCLPFFCSGATIAALLTRHAAFVHRLYLFDLVGAGIGSLLVVGLLPALGGSGVVFAAAALAAAAAALLAWEQGRRWSLCAGCIAAALLFALPFAGRLVPVRISSNKVAGGGVPVGQVLSDRRFNLFTAWNTLSRVDVIEFKDPSGGVHRTVLIDAGTAVTRMAHPQGPLDSLGPTVGEESFFVRLFEGPRVLVVGSGGGREVLLALRNGASKITAVEINPAINDLVSKHMADFVGHLYQHPKVEVVTDEARSFLRRSKESYQLIYCPHTISNSALSSGSLSLAENHLMTFEAFEDYLDHLGRDGVLVITRPEAHLPRLFATVRAVFAKRSLSDLEQRVLAWRQPASGLSFVAGFALRRRPFSSQEVESFARILAHRGLEPLYLPGGAAVHPYPRLLSEPNVQSVEVPFAAILEPATDDRPFFNRRVPFSKIRLGDLLGVFSPEKDGRWALEDRPVAEAALVVLLLETLLMAVLFIVLPLLVFRRRALSGAFRLRTLSAFACLGLAYIVIEVGFIQRFTLYLGRPVLVFSTVLGTLLVFSGLGSAFSRRFEAARAPLRACLAAGSAALLCALLTPLVVNLTLWWPAALRVLMAMLILAPLGFSMGMPFPLMVRRLEATYPERIPWAWGVNGFASVVGSIGAVILGMTAGYTVVLLFGVLCYLLAALSALGVWEKGQVES